MKTKALIAVLLAAIVAVAAERVRFIPEATSSVKISGTSTLHPWTVEGATIDGQIDIAPQIAASPASASAWATDRPALVAVKIPVNDLKSDHERMTRIMRDALKAKSFPDVSYELREATPTQSEGDAFTVKTTGRLTIAGVTRDLQMNVTATRGADQRYILTGEAPVRMTDFGITPPVTMLGALKTGDQVTVSFRWVVNRAQ